MTGLRFCRDCAHFREPLKWRRASGGRRILAGATEAATNQLRLYQQRRETEYRRVHEDLPFDSKPLETPWCARDTLDAEALSKIRAALVAGDDATIGAMRIRGVDCWTVDPVNGVVRPIYVLCKQKNERGDCEDFQPSESRHA
jgi:hypothetical protein